MVLPRWALVTIAVVFLFRLIVALNIPLTEDEAYYWTWSLHPAFGYTDHPPMVAWLIRGFAFLGTSPLAIRFPFIVCESIAAIAVGYAALVMSKDARAGGVAALIMTLLPQQRWVIGEAFPEPPYLCCWALALWLVARVSERANWRDMALLGLALGGALLSRFFGWALVFGIVAYALAPSRRALWRQGLWLALLGALVLYAPFAAWNWAHGWENIAFTFYKRRMLNAFSIENVTLLSALRFFGIVIFIAWTSPFALLKRGYDLLAWTALPLTVALAVLAFFQPVESYWLFGPLTSLCVGFSIAYVSWSAGAQIAWKSVGGVLAGIAIVTASVDALPENGQAAVLSATHDAVIGWVSLPVRAYRPLAADANALRARNAATVITDRYEVASELLYNGVTDPVVVGTAVQGVQWRRWYNADGTAPPHALLITHHPLGVYPDLDRRVHLAYGKVLAGPRLQYFLAQHPAQSFNTTFCDDRRPGAERFLFGG